MQFQAGQARVDVNIATRGELWQEVEARFAARKGFALATLNLDHLVKLGTSPAFAAAYNAQDFVVADGNPIVWLSKLAGQPVELMPGSELVVPLAKRAAALGVSVALLGSTEDALTAAGQVLQARAPGLRVACIIAPPFGFDPESDAAAGVLRQIEASGAGLCYLALGAPKQEILAARGRTLAPSVGFASIGAGLDFLAGTQNRAPKLAQKLALEWLWRLALSPRRLAGRYLSCMSILPRQVVQALRMRP